jgi:recombination protein RecT
MTKTTSTQNNEDLAVQLSAKNKNVNNALVVQHHLRAWKDTHIKTLEKFLRGRRDEAERLYLAFSHSVQRSTDLLECTKESLTTALLLCAQLGLYPGPFHEAAITWRRNKNGEKEAQFMPQYQGLVKLGKQTGFLRAANTNVVYEGDYFEYSEGTELFLKYKKSLKQDRGDRIAVYGVLYLPDEAHEMRIMTPAEIAAIKARSDAGKRGYGPWATDEDAMWMKTVIRQLCKFIPKQGFAGERLAQAIEIDDDIENPNLKQTPIVEMPTTGGENNPEQV